MADGLYRADPLSSVERAEFEEDLVSFCDRSLELLGDVSGLDVLYAGGAAPLWLEGLAEKIGPSGTLTALEADAAKVEEGRRWAADAGPPCPVRVVAGSVLSPPFAAGTFDLAYSAGLLHELDVTERGADEAVKALADTLKPGGRLATDDFVDSVPAAQLEEEALEAGSRRALHGEEPYGIGPPRRLVSLHETALEAVRWRVQEPFGLRHLDKLFLAEEAREPCGARQSLPPNLRQRRRALEDRIRAEGYTRPATLYVEGRRPA